MKINNKTNRFYVSAYKNKVKNFDNFEECKEDFKLNKSKISLITINDVVGDELVWCIVIYSTIDNINLMED